jgi:hypothetical protein
MLLEDLVVGQEVDFGAALVGSPIAFIGLTSKPSRCSIRGPAHAACKLD